MTDTQVLPEQRRALGRIAALLPSDAYLAGGVGLAARLHHRRSRDLDWFVSHADPLALVEPLSAAGVRILSQAEGTLYIELEGVPASIIRYSYPLLHPVEVLTGVGVKVASLDDLACMKLSAIAARGKARDFWDLHEILTRGPRELPQLLDAYRSKYTQQDVGHVVRSLVYFADAETDPMPEGLDAQHWTTIKKDLEQRVLAL